MKLLLCIIGTWTLCLLSTVPARAAEPTPAQLEFFEKKVRPVLVRNCYKCHGPKKHEAGLRLDSRASLLKGGDSGPAMVPGKPKQSELVSAINYDADGFQMPPNAKLKADEIAALTKWVQLGAPWPKEKTVAPAGNADDEFNFQERAKHWSFQPLGLYPPPEVKRADWPRTPIDRFILAKLESKGLTPAPVVDTRALLRRVTFDLIGLPPTRGEIADFLNDNSPDAYEKVVDRLLSSPHYGERWGRHWLDLVRFSETAGHEFDFPIHHAWPYRDYVVRAFNGDVPYDRFVVEHIAGDLVPRSRRHSVSGINESIIGTAFYWFAQGKHSPVDVRADECDTIDNQLDVLGKTFLGLTVACARCHDHKFDPLRARDYYALAGYLQSSRRQLAILDPPEKTQAVIDGLVNLRSRHGELLTKTAAARFQPALKRLAETLLKGSDQKLTDYLQKQAAKNPADPFYPWAVLAGIDNPKRFAEKRDAVLKTLRDQWRASMASSDRMTVFDDFTGREYSDWFVSGPAFAVGPSQGWESLAGSQPEKPIAKGVDAGLLHSGLVSGRLQGAIRSKTFTIEKPYIDYRMHRVGGKKNPGRQNKNGQVHLIVDGFQFIKNPLYGHLTINVHQGDDFRWYRQNLGKFIGQKAYIEVLDEDDGHVVIDKILFTDGERPPEPPNGFIIHTLGKKTIDSREALANAYQDLLLDCVKLWTSNEGRLRGGLPTAPPRAIRPGDLRSDARAGRETSPQQGVDPNDFNRLQNWLLNTDLLSARSTISANDRAAISRVLQESAQLESRIQPPMLTVAMVDGTGEDDRLLVRGNHKRPGEIVPRRFLEVFNGKEAAVPKTGSGRLHLARQIAEPKNPLTARVMVNRLWQHHFGEGIVATPDNFGKLGQPPTHPELLDYLAADFIRSGWAVKRMQRQMVLSSTYRMSSRPDDRRAEEADPGNRLLHRMPVRRLEGEIIRDAILAVSGRLNRQMQGESVMPFLTPFMEGRGRPGRSGPLDGDGRRSVYINVRRNFLSPMFLAFDFPTPLTTTGRRSVSNVPAQALTMMNNEFIVQQARVWAERLLRETPPSMGERIQYLYESAFARPPDAAELAAAKEFLQDQGQEYGGSDRPETWADLCHVLMNVKEFVFVN